MSACVAFAWVTSASADERTTMPATFRARVHVDAPTGCASDASFWRATSRKTARLRAADASAAEASLEVSIRPDERGVSGELRIVRGGATSAMRRVRGPSCDEVTQALSLVAALAFDPAARPDAPGEPTDANAASSTSSPPTSSTPPVPEASPVLPVTPATPSEDRPSALAPRANGSPARWRCGGGAHAGAIGLASPGAVLAYGAFLDLESDRAGFSPSVRAGAVRAGGAASSGGVDAELTWTLARASLCPVRIDLASGLALRPCAGVDAGWMNAHALQLARAQDRSRPWVAPTATARFAWAPHRVVFVELEAGVAIPLVRDEVAVDPSVTLYRAPSVAPLAQIAAGMRFP
jgi:hypothetical protein